MLIELCGLAKFTPTPHLYPTNLRLESGSFNVLLGATSSGKTTLMRLMAGLDKPSQGEVRFAGKNVTQIPFQKRGISMVYQQFINYPDHSVFDNIASPLKISRVSLEELEQRVQRMANLLRLDKVLHQKPPELSGGQQQRTALARALIKRAKLILLDEPLANLDYKLREELRDELPKLFTKSDSVVVYATTEPNEALMLGGSVTLLNEGRVIQSGPALSVYQNPCNLVSAMTFSDPPLNFISIQKFGKKMIFQSELNYPLPRFMQKQSDGNYTLALRPYHLKLKKQNTQSIELEMKVDLCEINGSETLLYLSQKSRTRDKKWIAQLLGIHEYQSGETIKVYLDLARALYFDSKNQSVKG